MRANFFLSLFGNLGIPIHSRELVAEYIKLNPEIRILPIGQGDIKKLDSSIRERIGKPYIDGTAFIFWYPHEFEQVVNVFQKTIGYYIFEYTKIPKPYVDAINKLDAICTASEWGKKVLIDNGVSTKIYVVPGGVNTLKFNKKIRRQLNPGDTFVFGHIGKYEERKNTDLVIKTFNRFLAENPKANVKLLLSISNPHIKQDPKELVEEKFGKNPNIEFVPFIDDIRNFYKRVHCTVFPTNAEGIGLPIVESLACGLPTIVSFNSGITEYANNDIAFLLTRLDKKPVYDPHFFPIAGELGEWDSPTAEELYEKMSYIYNNYDNALTIGDNAADFMHNKFNWKLAAIELAKVLEHVT